MFAFNVKIGNCAGGSVATPSKLTGYVIYRLGLALCYIYNAYLCIPISIKLFLSSACGCSYHTDSEPPGIGVCLSVGSYFSASVITNCYQRFRVFEFRWEKCPLWT